MDVKKEQNSEEELKQKLEECEKQKAEYLAGWQRARADFLNYKKEEVERIDEFLKYANSEFILKILPILDNFDLVEKNITEDLKNNEYIKGILQIKTQFLDFLKSQGVEPINCLGQKFDPNFHEVMAEVETENKEAGTIVEEVQKGYLINGNLLRPTKVKISK
jgi:molecular chaperone GrpE